MALRLACVVCLLGITAPAFAQTAPTAPASHTRRTLVFLAGGVAGLGIHELGHVIAGAAFGAHPRTHRLDSSVIPFFAIRHDPVSQRAEFVISSAGFWMQHLGSERILSAHGDLRHEDAAFAKGVLAFNLSASLVYGVAALSQKGPPERDTRGMAISLTTDGVPEPAIGLLVLGPAVLDGYRYLHPDATWAKWVSRGLKVAMVALTLAAQ